MNPDGSTYYYHNDHLGSTTLITDEEGDVISETAYDPFGSILSGGEEEVYLYTNQFRDAIGCYDYGARVYCPGMYHFTQADTVLPNPYNPQALNRYSYVLNNPYGYVDSDGHFPLLAVAAVGVIAVTSPYWAPYVSAYFTDQSIRDIQTGYRDPTPGNLFWAGVGAWDLATPGVPEGKIAKGGVKGLKGFTHYSDNAIQIGSHQSKHIR